MKQESKHTPGPWSWEYGADGIEVSVVDGLVSARYSRDKEAMRLEAEANARLIAQSPNLLAVLKQCLADHKQYAKDGDGDLYDERLIANMEDAEREIAKAEGRDA